MLYTNYYGCCGLPNDNYKLQGSPFEEYWFEQHPSDYAHLLQHTSQTALLHYCDVTNVTHTENNYYVVTWTVYLESSMYLRRR